jgi:ATP-dependent protease ClpP protease subunit
MIFLLLLLLNLTHTLYGYKNIELTNDNNIILKHTIDEESTSNIIYEINKLHNKKNLYLILDTNGGEVTSGMKIINEVTKYNISCIAIKAYSMGFAIFQSCKKRYVLPDSTVMQHQISLGTGGELGKIKSQLSLVQQYENYLVTMQMNRIKLSHFDFMNKIYNEWWSFGENIVFENIADEIIHIFCTPKLTQTNYTITSSIYDITYSSCPLITKELKKKKNKKGNDPFEFLFI